MHRIVLVENLKGKKVGRRRSRWEDNIKVDLKKVRCECVGWIQLVHNRVQWWSLVNTVMSLPVP
jgi:hypothetical protein